jgi:hypothetical protein
LRYHWLAYATKPQIRKGENHVVNVSSLFGQIVSGLFSAVNFDKLVAKWGAESHAKGFRSKAQLVSMIFYHLAERILSGRSRAASGAATGNSFTWG